MDMIYNIYMERRNGQSGKWQRESAETSHWPSAEPMLIDATKRWPNEQIRLIAELIPFPIPNDPEA